MWVALSWTGLRVAKFSSNLFMWCILKMKRYRKKETYSRSQTFAVKRSRPDMKSQNTNSELFLLHSFYQKSQTHSSFIPMSSNLSPEIMTFNKQKSLYEFVLCPTKYLRTWNMRKQNQTCFGVLRTNCFLYQRPF